MLFSPDFRMSSIFRKKFQPLFQLIFFPFILIVIEIFGWVRKGYKSDEDYIEIKIICSYFCSFIFLRRLINNL